MIKLPFSFEISPPRKCRQKLVHLRAMNHINANRFLVPKQDQKVEGMVEVSTRYRVPSCNEKFFFQWMLSQAFEHRCRDTLLLRENQERGRFFLGAKYV